MKYEKPNLEEMNLILEGSFLSALSIVDQLYEDEWF